MKGCQASSDLVSAEEDLTAAQVVEHLPTHAGNAHACAAGAVTSQVCAA